MHWFKVQWRTFCAFVPFLRPLLGMPMSLVFIRHAESLNNKVFGNRLYLETEDERKAQGELADHLVPLTEDGVQQAGNTGPTLRMRFGVPDVVIHSGYERTRQTARGVLGAYADKWILVKEDVRFRERENGFTYLMVREDVERLYPNLQTHWKMVGPFFARPPNGESLAEVTEKRLMPALKDLFREHSGKRVFVVSHGRVIQCARAYLDELDAAQTVAFLQTKGEDPKNCSLMVYRYSPEHGKLVLAEYNTVCWE